MAKILTPDDLNLELSERDAIIERLNEEMATYRNCHPDEYFIKLFYLESRYPRNEMIFIMSEYSKEWYIEYEDCTHGYIFMQKIKSKSFQERLKEEMDKKNYNGNNL